MATLEETLKDINHFISDVKELYPLDVAAAAETSASLISDRIGETGINAEGSQLGDYTDGVYKNKRANIGHPIGFVNLRFTGAMWNDLSLIGVKSNGLVTTATIGAKFPENNDKLFYNSVRYNDEILDINQEEEDIINSFLDDKLQVLADKNFK